MTEKPGMCRFHLFSQDIAMDLDLFFDKDKLLFSVRRHQAELVVFCGQRPLVLAEESRFRFPAGISSLS